MKIVFIVLAIVCCFGAVLVGSAAILLILEPWNDFEDVAYLFLIMTLLISGALLSAFAASVLHGFDRQVAATKELHSAIVASAKGEEPSLPTVEDNEVPTIPEAAKGPTKFTPATGKSAAKLRSDLGV